MKQFMRLSGEITPAREKAWTDTELGETRSGQKCRITGAEPEGERQERGEAVLVGKEQKPQCIQNQKEAVGQIRKET